MQRTVAGLSAADGAGIVQAYDFSKFARIVEVGGGHGALAVMIAEKCPYSELFAAAGLRPPPCYDVTGGEVYGVLP